LLAGDITNSEKHHVRTTCRISKDVKLCSSAILQDPIGTFPKGGIYKFIIEVQTEKPHEFIDAPELAKQCVTDWNKFINKYKFDYYKSFPSTKYDFRFLESRN